MDNDTLFLRIAELEKENTDLKVEIKKLEDIIVFLQKNYEDIGVKIEETKKYYHDDIEMKMHCVKRITIPTTTIAVPLNTGFAFSEFLKAD